MMRRSNREPLPAEIDFLLETIAPYWSRKPQASDIRSDLRRHSPAGPQRRFAQHGEARPRPRDSRVVELAGLDHGRQMDDLSPDGRGLRRSRGRSRRSVAHALPHQDLADPRSSRRISGRHIGSIRLRRSGDRATGGVERCLNQPLAERLPHVGAQVVWAARHEMARSVEDVLARRIRALFYDAEAARAAAPKVAELLAAELGRDAAWQADQLRQFETLAVNYCYRPECFHQLRAGSLNIRKSANRNRRRLADAISAGENEI